MCNIDKIKKAYRSDPNPDFVKGHNSYYIKEKNNIPKDEPCCRDGWDCYYFNNGGCEQGHKKNG